MREDKRGGTGWPQASGGGEGVREECGGALRARACRSGRERTVDPRPATSVSAEAVEAGIRTQGRARSVPRHAEPRPRTRICLAAGSEVAAGRRARSVLGNAYRRRGFLGRCHRDRALPPRQRLPREGQRRRTDGGPGDARAQLASPTTTARVREDEEHHPPGGLFSCDVIGFRGFRGHPGPRLGDGGPGPLRGGCLDRRDLLRAPRSLTGRRLHRQASVQADVWSTPGQRVVAAAELDRRRWRASARAASGSGSLPSTFGYFITSEVPAGDRVLSRVPVGEVGSAAGMLVGKGHRPLEGLRKDVQVVSEFGQIGQSVARAPHAAAVSPVLGDHQDRLRLQGQVRLER